MSSPIHKYLFSPPPSPPLRPSDSKHRPPALKLTSAKTLIAEQYTLDGSSTSSTSGFTVSSPNLNELIPRSPRTPQNRNFTFNDGFSASSSMYPSRTPRNKADLEAGSSSPYSNPATPTPRVVIHEPTNEVTPKRTLIEKSPSLLPTNIPTVTPTTYTLPLPTSLPKPLLRLLFLASLVISCLMILVFFPSTRPSSLHSASTSRRLALAEDGRAVLDVLNPVKNWREALDRDYVPAKIKSSKMLKRAFEAFEAVEQVEEAKEEQIAEETRSVALPNPRVTKTPSPRPLPETHELLALQSYLLGSAYNTLPENLDTQQPLDANLILGFANGEIEGSLDEIEKEWNDEVVIWFGGDGETQPPHRLLSLLSEIHGPRHKPTLIPLHSRPDLPQVSSILGRLSQPISSHPLIMIGNQPLLGDCASLERDSNKLRELMSKIGWRKSEDSRKGRDWKPRYAKVGKREVGEVEKALKDAKRRR